MSDNQSRRADDFAKYEAMTTKELEKILRLDSDAPEGQELGEEELLFVMEVLAHRKRNSENPGKTAQQAWRSFEANYMPEEAANEPSVKKDRPWVRRWIAVAAVVAIIIAFPFTARAFGWDGPYKAVARWTKGSTFFFSAPDYTVPTATPSENLLQYETLQDALNQAGINYTSIPTRIPEGFSLIDITIDQTPRRKICIGYYKNGDKDFMIIVHSYLPYNPGHIEISGDLLELYEVDGVEYYFFANNSRHFAAWVQGPYECSISGELTVEEIKMMIDSIEKG